MLNDSLTFLLTIVTAYCVGSIPSAVLICAITGYGNILQQGSGNPGATNVYRITKSKILTFCTLAADMGKGVCILLWLQHTHASIILIQVAFFSVLLGSLFSVFLKFKGGKGVAVTIGMLSILFPDVAYVIVITWILVFICSKISSLATLISLYIGYAYALIHPILHIPFADLGIVGIAPIPSSFLVLLALTLGLISLKHYSNIKKLIKGQEQQLKP